MTLRVQRPKNGVPVKGFIGGYVGIDGNYMRAYKAQIIRFYGPNTMNIMGFGPYAIPYYLSPWTLSVKVTVTVLEGVRVRGTQNVMKE